MRYGLANTNYRDEITGFLFQIKTQTKFTGCQSMQISNSKMQYIGSIAYPGAQTLRIFKSPGPGIQGLEQLVAQLPSPRRALDRALSYLSATKT